MDDLDNHPKMRWKDRTPEQMEQIYRMIEIARQHPVKLSVRAGNGTRVEIVPEEVA